MAKLLPWVKRQVAISVRKSHMVATPVFFTRPWAFLTQDAGHFWLPFSRCPGPLCRITRYCRVPLSLHCHQKISALVISHSREATVKSRVYYQEYQNFTIRRNLLLLSTSPPHTSFDRQGKCQTRKGSDSHKVIGRITGKAPTGGQAS